MSLTQILMGEKIIQLQGECERLRAALTECRDVLDDLPTDLRSYINDALTATQFDPEDDWGMEASEWSKRRSKAMDAARAALEKEKTT